MFAYLLAFMALLLIIFGTAYGKTLNDSLHATIIYPLSHNLSRRDVALLNNRSPSNSPSTRSLTRNYQDEHDVPLVGIENDSLNVGGKFLENVTNLGQIGHSGQNVSLIERETNADDANASAPIETPAKTFRDSTKESLLETLRSTIQQHTFLNSNQLYNLLLTDSRRRGVDQKLESDELPNAIIAEALNEKLSGDDGLSNDFD